MECLEEKSTDIQWKDIYDFTTECGKAHDPKSLAIEIVSNIGQLCAFDQALVYFFDGNGKVCDQYLMNLDEYWSTLYLRYYYNADNQRYSCYKRTREDLSKITHVYDWDKEPSAELVPNLICPRGLKYSCGFLLFDLDGNYRTIVSLDRLGDENFSSDELMNLQLAIIQLNNLNKNFHYQGVNAIRQATWETSNLTTREIEIADLLCQGISPANISRTLYIAPSTTNKHISHIYEKLHVSSRQELLVRLLRQPG